MPSNDDLKKDLRDVWKNDQWVRILLLTFCNATEPLCHRQQGQREYQRSDADHDKAIRLAGDALTGIVGNHAAQRAVRNVNRRVGQRHQEVGFRPWLLWVSVPYVVFSVMMFTTPDWTYHNKVIWAFVTYFLMSLTYTAINIPYCSSSKGC